MELVSLRKKVDAEDTGDAQTTTLTEPYFLLLQKGIWLDAWHCVSRLPPKTARFGAPSATWLRSSRRAPSRVPAFAARPVVPPVRA